MSIRELLPPDYVFGEGDFKKSFEIMLRYEDATDTELELMTLAQIAEEMQRKNGGKWPTVDEADAEFWRQQDEYWQKHFNRNAPR
ncbi:MAG TPA: hypothetical protein VMP68_14530 [Candidatus Eisenbacteria bacterium]|nr:hypothetical protein [Candidatus Eisenbacteria bacterium]